MQGRPLLFVDVETTGSAPWNSRVLELGALRVENGAVVDSMNMVLDPEEPVPGWITGLTGIEASETVGQPVFADIVTDFQKLMCDAIFVAHNVSFDYGFLHEEFRKAGARFQIDKLCTVRLSRALYPGERSHKLDSVIARGGYEVARRHRAYDDAEVLYKFWNDSRSLFGEDRVEALASKLIWPNQSKLFM